LYNIRSFRHPSEVHVPPMRHNGHSKLRRNAIHIHISYRIHAHRNKVTTPMVSYKGGEGTSRFTYSIQYGRNDHYQQPRIDWHPAPFHYQQDTV
jgi:hypothetical protein